MSTEQKYFLFPAPSDIHTPLTSCLFCVLSYLTEQCLVLFTYKCIYKEMYQIAYMYVHASMFLFAHSI